MISLSELYDIFCAHRQVTTDSRICPEGSLFFALKGDNFDGNRFAQAALDKGCAYAVVDEAEFATNERILLVDNVLHAMQQLARMHRERLGVPVVGITGTNGKTTTKELVAAVLREKFNVHYTQGNFNNHIGVPLTLLQLTENHEVAVVEMGASHLGEIAELVVGVGGDLFFCGVIVIAVNLDLTRGQCNSVQRRGRAVNSQRNGLCFAQHICCVGSGCDGIVASLGLGAHGDQAGCINIHIVRASLCGHITYSPNHAAGQVRALGRGSRGLNVGASRAIDRHGRRRQSDSIQRGVHALHSDSIFRAIDNGIVFVAAVVITEDVVFTTWSCKRKFCIAIFNAINLFKRKLQ